MGKFVRATQLIRAFKQSATPTVAQGLNVDDTWVDTDDHTFYVCTSISPVTFVATSGAGGTPGGSDTQVQYNDATAFGGDSGFTYVKATHALTISGVFTASNVSGTNTGDQSPAGSTTQVQFNDAGSFAGNSALVFDKATGTLTATIVKATSGVSIKATSNSNLLTLGPISSLAASRAVLFSPSASCTITLTGSAMSLSGTNTGDQTSVSGNAGTVTNGVYTTDTGSVTNTMLAGSIANSKLANGAVANLSGTNTGDQTITLTGDVTGSGAGSFATTMANTAVTPGSYTTANITVDSKGRVTAASNGSGGSGDVVGPSSSTDNTLPRFDSTTGKLIQSSGVVVDDSDNVTATSYKTTNTGGIKILDTDASNTATLKMSQNLTADRTWNLNMGNADRTLTVSADTTLNGTPLAAASNLLDVSSIRLSRCDLYQQLGVTSGGTLNWSSQPGRIYAFQNSSAITRTFDSVSNAGSNTYDLFLDIEGQCASNAIAGIAPASGEKLDGVVDQVIKLGFGDSLSVRTNGSGSQIFVHKSRMYPVAFGASSSAGTSASNNTWTKVKFDTEDFDIGSCFDSSTNYRHTPLWAGTYNYKATVSLSPTLAGQFTVAIYKNGSAVKQANLALTVSLKENSVSIDADIVMNGSTDYIEIFILQDGGGSETPSTGTTKTYFYGRRVAMY